MVARGERRAAIGSVVGMAFTPEGREWALFVAREFRRAGIRTLLDLSGRSIGQQLSNISRIAEYAVIIGARERDNKMVTMKDLRSGIQKEQSLKDTLSEVSGGDPR